MVVRSGFYPSVNGDRKYSATELSTLFSALYTDGIFQADVPNHGGGSPFSVTPNGNHVILAPGRAWYRNSWLLVDAPENVTLYPTHATQPRYDIVFLRFDGASRINTIETYQGVPHATAPVKPSAPYQHGLNANLLDVPLAYVYRTPARTIRQSDISSTIGTAVTPWVTLQIQGEDYLSRPILEKPNPKKLLLVADEATGGLSRVALGELAWSINNPLLGDSASLHANIYRGKAHGVTMSYEKIAAIRDGSFDDIYIGDTFGNWRVADINYWYGRGINSPHVVLVEDEPYSAPIALYDATYPQTGGYANSKHLKPSEPTVPGAPNWVPWILPARLVIPSSQDSLGRPTGTIYKSLAVSAMNEIMAFGCRANSTIVPGSPVVTEAVKQFALFRLVPGHLTAGVVVGLRDSATATSTAVINQAGYASYASWSSWTTRLVACVG